jgi:hypothetical protein
MAMTDLRDRFTTLDRLRAPDLWAEATRRAAADPAPARPLLARFALPMIAAAVSVVVLALLLGVIQPWRPHVGTAMSPKPSPTASEGPMSLRDAFSARSAYPPGQYWWDPAGGFWIHKPDAGTELAVTLGFVDPTLDLSTGETVADYVAGRPGGWTRLPVEADGVRIEVWNVVIDDTPVVITLKAQASATTADIAEARIIVDSIRTEPWNQRLGFRFVVTLPKGWDSA